MDFIHRLNALNRFKRYFLFFFLIGQNVCFTKGPKFNRILSWIPSIFTIFLIIFSENYQSAKKFKEIERDHGVILQTLVWSNLLPSLFATIESFRMPYGTQCFDNLFSLIINQLETKTKLKISWQILHKQIFQRFKIICICLCVTILFRITFHSPLHGQRYEIMSLIVWFYKTMTLFHTMFYVELLNFLFSSITSRIDLTKIQHTSVWNIELCLGISEVINILNTLKFYHFQVWKCYQIINKHFGYIIIAITIDTAYTLANSSYWAFYYWMHGHNYLVYLQK